MRQSLLIAIAVLVTLALMRQRCLAAPDHRHTLKEAQLDQGFTLYGTVLMPVQEVIAGSLCGQSKLCLQAELETNHLLTEQSQCVSAILVGEALHLQLTFQAALSGAGVLTVAIQGTSIKASVFVNLTGHAKHVTVDLSRSASSKQPPSGAATGSGAAASIRAEPSVMSAEQFSFSTPVPLTYGAAIQLQQLPMFGTAKAVPYYAVSEEVLMTLTDRVTQMADAGFRTPFEGTMQGILGLSPHNSFVCPAAAASAVQSELLNPGKPSTAITKPMPFQHHDFAWLSWVLCLCLLLCNIGLVVCRPWQRFGSSLGPQKAVGLHQEPSYVDSSQKLITPTKDTGCSPFVPVQLVPTFNAPYGHDHLASCSSKIGSFNVSRPATSKAVTNLTSNVSGCTKWQRSKNGRLLSHALQEPDEFTS